MIKLTDYLGRELKAGQWLAYAVKRGSSGAYLSRRYVREVKNDHIVVSTGKAEILDKRTLGKITQTNKVIIIAECFDEFS